MLHYFSIKKGRLLCQLPIAICLLLFAYCPLYCFSQNESKTWWHGKERNVHYLPEGGDFITVNGKLRFNRALYGGNTAFRAEAGDLPEFALYLPGMGGNFKFGLMSGDKNKWLIESNRIEARYRPGSMLYKIEDELLAGGYIELAVLPMFDKEGIIVKLVARNIPATIQLTTTFGGATGLKFSRDGDIGADPESSFYLQPGYCRDNVYRIEQNSFDLFFGSKKALTEEERYEIQHIPGSSTSNPTRADLKNISGIFPSACMLKVGDANLLQTPATFFQSHGGDAPALAGIMDLNQDTACYFLIQNKKNTGDISYADLSGLWEKAESSRKQIAERITIDTPDPFINTLGGALSIAADAIWEEPSYMHGAVAWRMRLNGWRGAYVADVLGWHDRARRHFDSYALSQLTTPLTAAVVMDTALHLARSLEKLGTSMFSSGYISRNPNGDFRPHHYDMNLVFVDQLLNHFRWTGDTAYIRHSWPLTKRHLDWEKRNFDTDGDGLYDSYAAIWASDALQYSGGGVTHSSAYNYRSNVMIKRIAGIIGIADSAIYQNEAKKILRSINQYLWMPDKGWYAEYKDLLGEKLLHPSAGLWTIYHAIDSKVPDPFQAYQLLNYVNNELPHIPIRANGLKDSSLFTLATTNWQPYTWSLNNVALAELLHTSLSYWQAGRAENAYTLWKSSLIESMYLGASPGNIQQLSFYDAIRGELYRDFADPVGMTARSLVEGLFGIVPDALQDTLFLQPGFPAAWTHAAIKTPDINFSYSQNSNTDKYEIHCSFPTQMKLKLQINARSIGVEEILVNGKKLTGYLDDNAIGNPILIVALPEMEHYSIEVKWKEQQAERPIMPGSFTKGDTLSLSFKNATILKVYDPQKVIGNISIRKNLLQAIIFKEEGNHCFFIQVQQGDAKWWIPVEQKILPEIQFLFSDNENKRNIILVNNSRRQTKGELQVNNKPVGTFGLAAGEKKSVQLLPTDLLAGSNDIVFKQGKKVAAAVLLDWHISNDANTRYEKIDLSSYFNDEVNNIFKHEYLSPRPAATVLQLPTQGIGNWAYPLTTAIINDSALRKKAGTANEYRLEQGIPFSTPGSAGTKNVLFTSQWDNYPDSITVPLKGKASHAYFLMAGSTNPMQSRLVNGEVIIQYKDGSTDVLALKNPENWWPIEQDYYDDGYAFTTGAPRPLRVYFNTAKASLNQTEFITIKGFSSRGVQYGAATVLDLPLDPKKELKQVIVKAIANDVIIGLMSLTLTR